MNEMIWILIADGHAVVHKGLTKPIAIESGIKGIGEDMDGGKPSPYPMIALKLNRELNRSSDLPPAEDPLTLREVMILKLVAQGLTNQEIAERLVISNRTVGNYIGNILSKLHLTNRTQATLYALREGIADL